MDLVTAWDNDYGICGPQSMGQLELGADITEYTFIVNDMGAGRIL